MVILDNADRTIQVELGGAVNTNELDMVASFVDIGAPDVYEPGAGLAVTTGATAAVLVPAPATGRKRQLKYLSIANIDDQANSVRVFIDDDATDEYTLITVTLGVGSHLYYTDGEGFHVIDATGQILVTASP